MDSLELVYRDSLGFLLIYEDSLIQQLIYEDSLAHEVIYEDSSVTSIETPERLLGCSTRLLILIGSSVRLRRLHLLAFNFSMKTKSHFAYH